VDQSSDVFFKFSFIAGCEEFQKEFTAQAVDHSYDNVYEVVRKSVELYRANGSLHIPFEDVVSLGKYTDTFFYS
jgi:hypothetical protein